MNNEAAVSGPATISTDFEIVRGIAGIRWRRFGYYDPPVLQVGMNVEFRNGNNGGFRVDWQDVPTTDYEP